MHHRIASEIQFHDEQARRRAAGFAAHPERLRFTDDQYLDHETWIRPAFKQLGDVAGLPVLDFGCGHGMAAVVLAHRGARVTAFDLSSGYLAEARARAQANQVALTCLQADGEKLPFADGSFERIWGNAVLHHLDIEPAARELRRVLQPGGWAVFCEPWGENPLLRWARQRLPYRGKARTPDEVPLGPGQVRALEKFFEVQVTGHQLLGMVGRMLPTNGLVQGLAWCDHRLLAWLPGLQRWCRYVVLTLRPCR